MVISDRDIDTLRANQRFLVRELLSRNIPTRILDRNNELVEVLYNGRYEIFYDIDSSLVPYVASVVAGSKSITKRLLKRKKLSVPRGIACSTLDQDQLFNHAQVLGFPVVVKPSLGIQGRGVHTGIENSEELKASITSIVNERGHCEVLIEEMCPYPEYRVFITRNKDFAVLHRDSAHVIGDGERTITELARDESIRRMNPRVNCLCAIVLDDEARRYLGKRGMTFATRPLKGEKVYLRGSSNVMMGGVPRDVTDTVHPSLIDRAFKALTSIPALPYAGIDILCSDISMQQNQDTYKILEINSAPGIGIHHAPGIGCSRNVAGMIIDMLFPESCSATDRKRISRCAVSA